MKNKAMEHKLATGEAIDVSEFPRATSGEYVLDSFVPNTDYCNAVTEEWIISIGIHIETGQIFASTTDKFYKAAGYQCLYLK